MYRVLLLFSVLVAPPTLLASIRAQDYLCDDAMCDTASCDSMGECSCGGCDGSGACDAIGGCSSGCKKCNSLWTRDRLLGDTFGPKSCLAEHGVMTDFIFGQYYQGVTTGGNEQKGAYGGVVDMYFTFLGEKFNSIDLVNGIFPEVGGGFPECMAGSV